MISERFVEDVVVKSVIAYAVWVAVNDPYVGCDTSGPSGPHVEKADNQCFTNDSLCAEPTTSQLNTFISIMIRNARENMAEAFRYDPDFRRVYSDNIAMCIYDNVFYKLGIEMSKEIRDEISDKILKLIFE